MLKSENSLRSDTYGGVSYLGLDRYTKSLLKQLAGDIPVSHYVRELAKREIALQGKGKALSGQEHMVSANTLPAISTKLDTVLKLMGELDERAIEALGITGKWSPDSLHLLVAKVVKEVVERLKTESTEVQANLFNKGVESQEA